MHPLRSIARLVRRLLTPLTYVLAFVLPPLLVLAVGLGAAILQDPLAPPPAFAGQLPERPAHDPARRTAACGAPLCDRGR